MRNGLNRLSRAALCVAACFGGVASTAAAPALPKVVAGQASFSQDGNVFSITNTPGTIINWQSFSVNAGEVTRFIQQGSDSAVLNRIIGQDPSRILGALQSNGKVFLINPNGVVFGQGARVDVNGLVASTLDMSDSDFLAGKKNFSAGPTAGNIRNEGAITTPGGGKVFLVAPNVENSGVITAPNGEVVLAAGRSVQLVDSGNPDLSVVVSAPNDQAINLGQVVSQGGRVGIYGALVNQRGVVNANSAVVGQDGRIVLKASRETKLEGGSVTSAIGTGKGGEIQLLGERVSLSGNAQVDASGAAGGGTVLVGGDYQGKNAALPNAQQTSFGKDAGIRADATVSGEGGKVVLWSDGATVASGSISARGAGAGKGGLVETSGRRLDIDGVRVEAGGGKSGGGNGSWLIDPENVVIGDGVSSNETSYIKASTLTASNTDIRLEATRNLSIQQDIITAHNVRADAGEELTVAATVRSTAGSIDLRAKNHIKLLEGSLLASPEYIDLKAERMTLAGMIEGIGSTLPVVSFNTFNNGTSIVVGASQAGGGLTLAPSRLAVFKTYGINIGNSGHTGDVVIDDPLTLAGNLVIDTGGAVRIDAPVRLTGASNQFIGSLHNPLSSVATVGKDGSIEAATKISLLGASQVRIDGTMTSSAIDISARSGGIAGSGRITADALVLVSGGGIGSDGSPLRTSATHVDALNDVIGGNAPISIQNDRALTAGDVVQTGSGDIRLVTDGNLTIQGRVSSESGNVTLLADKGGALTIGPAGRVASASGNISLAGGQVSYPQGSVVGKLEVVQTKPDTQQPDPVEPDTGRPDPVQPEPTPPQLNVCLANPATTGCSGVIEQATRTCMGNPDGPSCDQVLPPVDSCRSNPGRLGCDVVMQREEIRQCILTPKAPGCGSVLPPYDTCEKTPGTYGCAPVIAERNAVTACMATPTAPGCAETLPPLAACRLDAGLYGCAPVIARAEFLACVANPSGAGCGERLPALSICKAAPSIEGCAQVMQLAFNACLVNKNDPSCAGILPTLAQCEANKALAGCSVVLPSMQQCILGPTQPGCAVILPRLEQCAVNPTLQGCEAVLPKPDFCSTHPLDPRCAVFNPAPSQGGGESKKPVAEVQQNTVNLINTRTPAQEKLPAATPVGGTQDGEGGTGGGSKPSEQSENASGPAAGTNTGAKNEKPATKMYCN